MERVSEVEHHVAAPFMVQNEFYRDFTFYRSPLQRLPGFFPAHEWRGIYPRKIIHAAERLTGFYVKWLEKAIQNQGISRIHAHFGPAACHVLPLAQKLALPLTASFYGYDYRRAPQQRPRYRQQYQALFQYADQVNPQGRQTAKVLAEMGCPPEKIRPTVLGADIELFPCIARQKQRGSLRLLQSASITAKKGYMDTLRALNLARRTCPNIHLTISGEPLDVALVREMRAFIRQNRLEAHVQWLDFVLHQNMPQLMAQDFQVFVHPSVLSPAGDMEDCPVVISEAMASGLPVLSTRHFNIPDMVPHRVAGLLSDEHDVTALAAHFQRFYFMKNVEYQHFVKMARQQAENNFSMENMANGWRQLYGLI